MSFLRKQLCLVVIILFFTAPICTAETLKPFDKQVKKWAMECRDEVTAQFNLLLTSGKLSVPQLFDTFYIPIPNTSPQKFRTQYDTLSDGIVLPIIDHYLTLDKRLVFVIAVDRNGYLPTHNSRYTKPLTGDLEKDAKGNRTKRIFNDRTGLAAARNEKPYLLQRYSRDTGEVMSDLSVPIYIQNRHWGAIRIGYRQK
jgi:methyl-accepting chemotaxis protein